MEEAELTELLEQAAGQISSLTLGCLDWRNLIEGSRVMRSNDDAQVYDHLRESFDEFARDFGVSATFSPQGHSKTIELGQGTLIVTVVHREPSLEKINGVDLFYALDDQKVAAFQHKKRAKNERLNWKAEDAQQNEKIRNLCAACRFGGKSTRNISFLRPYCAGMYVIGTSDGSTKDVISACKIDSYRTSFGAGPRLNERRPPIPSDLPTVDRTFIQCLSGRVLDRKASIMVDMIKDVAINQPDIVIEATLRMRSRPRMGLGEMSE